MAAAGHLLLAVGLTLATACSSGSGGSGDAGPTTTAPHRLRIVATTPILGEVAEAVAGDRADVTVLMDRTDDPRTFALPVSSTATATAAPAGDGAEDPLASADRG
ncbi:MAG: metal ABC transporter solute-binding protein, Zn/Mn family, partial [Acidimicrobiales bacterium]